MDGNEFKLLVRECITTSVQEVYRKMEIPHQVKFANREFTEMMKRNPFDSFPVTAIDTILKKYNFDKNIDTNTPVMRNIMNSIVSSLSQNESEGKIKLPVKEATGNGRFRVQRLTIYIKWYKLKDGKWEILASIN